MLEFLTQFYVIAASMFATLVKWIRVGNNAELTQTAVQNVEPFAAVHAVNGVFIIPPTILVLMSGRAIARQHRA